MSLVGVEYLDSWHQLPEKLDSILGLRQVLNVKRFLKALRLYLIFDKALDHVELPFSASLGPLGLYVGDLEHARLAFLLGHIALRVSCSLL